MTTSRTPFDYVVPAAIALAVAFAHSPSTAEPATDLSCRGCVGTRDLGRKSVTKKAIGKNAVLSGHIKDGEIQPQDLSPAAQPTAVAYAEDDSPGIASVVGPTPQSFLSVTIDAATPGYAVVSANWIITSSGTNVIGRCFLATAPDVEDGLAMHTYSQGGSAHVDGLSMSRTFAVAAGKTTFHLNCMKDQADQFVVLQNQSMTALFVPTRY